MFSECTFVEYEVSFEEPNTLPEGATTYINTVCPPEGLTINACGRDGKVILYISKNLSPAMYDERIEIEEGKCDNTLINCSTDNENGTLNIDPEGQFIISTFVHMQCNRNNSLTDCSTGNKQLGNKQRNTQHSP